MSAATLTSTGARRIVWAITGAVLCLAVAAAAGLALAAGAPTQRASGDQQWAQLFTPPGQLDCRAVAAVAAPDGSLYVAASAAVATGAPHNIVLLKYSPDGTPAWQRTMGGSGDDRPAALAVDGNGNVVLAGTTHGTTTGTDAYVVKYSPAGARRWAAHYRGPAGGADTAADVAVDPSTGNVYLAATTSGVGGRRATLVKFTATGHRAWARRCTVPAPSSAAALVVDAAGSAYVCGSYRSRGDLEGLVLKYSKSGILAWSASAVGARQRDSAFTDIAISPQGRIYACGRRGIALGASGVLVAYKAQSGQPAWTVTLSPAALGENIYQSVTCDAAGNAVVVGEVAGAGSTGVQAVTAKYRPSGSTQWMQFYNATTTGDPDTLSAVAVDAASRVFAVGTSHTAAGDRMLALSYSSDGVPRWAALYDGPAGASGGVAVALGRSASVYAVGSAASSAVATESAAVSFTPSFSWAIVTTRSSAAGTLSAIDAPGKRALVLYTRCGLDRQRDSLRRAAP